MSRSISRRRLSTSLANAPRAARRGLTNITFVRAPIEEIATLGVGSFDYIVSAGVLHHLPSPEAGLAALAAVLNEGAAMGLMVYGRYGRLDIYQLQDLFRQIAPPSLPTEQRLEIVKSVLRRLGPDHWGNLAGSLWKTEIKAAGDAGLFDLFLHSTDRAYTVPEVHDLLASAGMRLARFDVPILYDPRLNWPTLDLSGKSEPELQAIAEALHGRMKKHTFFAIPLDAELPLAPSPSDLDAIPVWLLHDPALLMRQVEVRPQLDLLYEGMDFHCTLDLFRREFLRQVDGSRSTGQILECIAPRLPKYDDATLRSAWFKLHEALSMFNVLGLTSAAG